MLYAMYACSPPPLHASSSPGVFGALCWPTLSHPCRLRAQQRAAAARVTAVRRRQGVSSLCVRLPRRRRQTWASERLSAAVGMRSAGRE